MEWKNLPLNRDHRHWSSAPTVLTLMGTNVRSAQTRRMMQTIHEMPTGMRTARRADMAHRPHSSFQLKREGQAT